jgi:wobble nucleotide-excising tRNase
MNPYLQRNVKRLTDAIEIFDDMSQGIEYTADAEGCPFSDASKDLCEVRKALQDIFVGYYALYQMEVEGNAELRNLIHGYKQKIKQNG